MCWTTCRGLAGVRNSTHTPSDKGSKNIPKQDAGPTTRRGCLCATEIARERHDAKSRRGLLNAGIAAATKCFTTSCRVDKDRQRRSGLVVYLSACRVSVGCALKKRVADRSRRHSPSKNAKCLMDPVHQPEHSSLPRQIEVHIV